MPRDDAEIPLQVEVARAINLLDQLAVVAGLSKAEWLEAQLEPVLRHRVRIGRRDEVLRRLAATYHPDLSVRARAAVMTSDLQRAAARRGLAVARDEKRSLLYRSVEMGAADLRVETVRKILVVKVG